MPVILLGAIVFLLCSQFGFLYKCVRTEVDKITRKTSSKCQQPLQSIDWKPQKHIYIAMLLDQEDQEGIKKLMSKEIEMHRNEGKAICCFKVNLKNLVT